MKIIDISWPITPNITAYKNRATVSFTPTKTFERDGARETMITLSTHTGTHVDAPAHFLRNGDVIDAMPLQSLVGSARVIELTHCAEKITADDLASCAIVADEIVLFKTRNSRHAPTDLFDASFIYLDASGGAYLAERGVRAVGIDYLGIERGQPKHETHCALLEKNIPIIEGLRLGEAPAGQYTFICLPIAVQGLEAAPARAILCEGEV